MLWPIRWLVWAVFRFLLSLRYWVTVKGMADVFRHPGPYLILPNHPAYSDPPNLLMRLWPAFQMRPLTFGIRSRRESSSPRCGGRCSHTRERNARLVHVFLSLRRCRFRAVNAPDARFPARAAAQSRTAPCCYRIFDYLLRS